MQISSQEVQDRIFNSMLHYVEKQNKEKNKMTLRKREENKINYCWSFKVIKL